MQFNTIRSWDEIDRVCKIAKEMDHCVFIVAIGGGKAVDLGKGVATVILSLLIVIRRRWIFPPLSCRSTHSIE